MKNKKIIAFIMAVMMLAMVSPAYASESDDYTTVIEALAELPEVVVTLPSSGEIYFNPYKLPVEIDGENLTDQIISTPASIENESDVPLNVSVTLFAVPNEGSNMTLTTSSTKGSSLSTKKVFIYFEMQASSNPSQAVWDSEYDAEKHLVVRTTSRTRKNIATIDQADKPNHYGAFRLTGDCIPTPRLGWTEDDGVTVEIAFTFTPLARVNS